MNYNKYIFLLSYLILSYLPQSSSNLIKEPIFIKLYIFLYKN